MVISVGLNPRFGTTMGDQGTYSLEMEGGEGADEGCEKELSIRDSFSQTSGEKKKNPMPKLDEDGSGNWGGQHAQSECPGWKKNSVERIVKMGGGRRFFG